MSVITKTTYSEPNQKGYFGAYGGKFVPETLIPALNELEKAYKEGRILSEAGEKVYNQEQNTRSRFAEIYQ